MFREIDGEAVLLELESGRYFGLDPIGTRMWRALDRHGRVRAAYEDLLAELEVEEERLREDLLNLIDQLAERGLMTVDADYDADS